MIDKNHTTTHDELRNAKLQLTGDVEADAENLIKVDNTPVIALPVDETVSNNNNEVSNKDAATGSNKDDKGNLPNPYKVLD